MNAGEKDEDETLAWLLLTIELQWVQVAWNKINLPVVPSWAISKIVSLVRSNWRWSGTWVSFTETANSVNAAADGYCSRPSAAPVWLVIAPARLWLLHATCDLISFQFRFKPVFTRKEKWGKPWEGRDGLFWRWQFSFILYKHRLMLLEDCTVQLAIGTNR